jgi:hypothetical protein
MHQQLTERATRSHAEVERITANLTALTEARIPYKVESKTVVRIDTRQGAVMYYPKINEWQHRGKAGAGSPAVFVGWVRSLRPFNREIDPSV